MPTNTDEVTEEVTCDSCEGTYNELYDHDMCEGCYYDNYSSCNDCSEEMYREDSYYVENDHYVCSNCFENYIHCEECDSYYYEDNTCGTCEQETRSRVKLTAYDTSDKLCKRAVKGQILKSKRAFGVEIEMFFGSKKGYNLLNNDMPVTLGKGTDVSIKPNKRKQIGIELRTPKLAGKKGEKYIREICDKINSIPAHVNKSCGLHVHLDCSDFYIEDKKSKEEKRMFIEDEHTHRLTVATTATSTAGANAWYDLAIEHLEQREYTKTLDNNKTNRLFLFYVLFEQVLYSFIPRTRRLDRFAQPIGNIFSSWQIMNGNAKDTWKNGHGEKYKGFNLTSLIEAGHVEIRNHSGTTNADKILHWINLHATILDKSVTLNSANITNDVSTMVYLEEKTDYMFKLLKLNGKTEDYLRERQDKFRTLKEEKDYTPTPELCVV